MITQDILDTVRAHSQEIAIELASGEQMCTEICQKISIAEETFSRIKTGKRKFPKKTLESLIQFYPAEIAKVVGAEKFGAMTGNPVVPKVEAPVAPDLVSEVLVPPEVANG